MNNTHHRGTRPSSILLETRMTMAPLPDHKRINDPLWRRLFRSYSHLIDPLRHNGWVTDIEFGQDFLIRVDVDDETELSIDCGEGLPLDPAEVRGWVVRRQEKPDARNVTVLYDSTPGGAQAQHGTNLIPLLTGIEEFVTTSARLHVSATVTAPSGVSHTQGGPIERPGTAIARHFEWARQLVVDEGYRKVWERPNYGSYPLTLFENSGHTATVRVTPWHD